MLKDTVIAQKAELENTFREEYVERRTRLFSLEHNLIKVIVGPRRAGKSFFAAHRLRQSGALFGYANFDNEELAGLESCSDLLSEINQAYGNPRILFFDEVQNLPKWELFVNRLQRQGYNIVVTGSNSRLLSMELATHLTGRHLPTTILTFSFDEYLNAAKADLASMTVQQKEELLLAYLRNGGYPETVTKNLDARQYLDVLLNSILYKDIIRRHNVRKGKEIEGLALYLLSNASSEFSYLSLAASAGIKSSITAQKYLGYLEEAYLFFTISRFSWKTRRPAAKRKAYAYDNGMITAKAFQTTSNIGRLFENCVAVHLKRREAEEGISMYYWRNAQGEEVDFVVKKGAKVVELIQACYLVEDAKTRSREIRALLKAGEELRCENLIILTAREEKECNEEWFGIKGRVFYKPLWKWLLGTALLE